VPLKALCPYIKLKIEIRHVDVPVYASKHQKPKVTLHTYTGEPMEVMEKSR